MGLNGLNINNVVRWEVLSDLRNGVPSHGRGGGKPLLPKNKGRKGIKEKQSSSDGGIMGIMCSGCFLLYSNEIAKVVEKLPRNHETSQDANSAHFSSDEKSAYKW